jgi:acyl carrier protein
MEEVLTKIIEAAAQLFGKDPSELGADTNFVEDLAAKSVNYVQIIAVLEEEYDVEIPFISFRRNKTFGEAAAYVQELCEM